MALLALMSDTVPDFIRQSVMHNIRNDLTEKLNCFVGAQFAAIARITPTRMIVVIVRLLTWVATFILRLRSRELVSFLRLELA